MAMTLNTAASRGQVWSAVYALHISMVKTSGTCPVLHLLCGRSRPQMVRLNVQECSPGELILPLEGKTDQLWTLAHIITEQNEHHGASKNDSYRVLCFRYIKHEGLYNL